MTDNFADQAAGLESPAAGAFAISPSNLTVLPTTSRAIYIGIGGTLTVEMKWGGVVSFSNLPDGALLPIRVTKVLEASTASSIVGLY